ncbi:hypothetical protein ARAM_005642 [Aspergillus rambellii]|uniref:GPI anchored cell wall protein n=1 Tax=Aspergillus rambellii TaxID=308745 RepID=A0A0F8VJP4_9EURO|nr:hypothetical protein ARAM_005642 [Aspergillus rambellii]
MIVSRALLAAATFTLTASGLPQFHPTTATNINTGITIINNLNTTIYLWSTASNDLPITTTIPASGGTHHETWQPTPDGSGVSLKLSTTAQSTASVLQFEYTTDEPAATLFWDLSCIDLSEDSAFVGAGFSATPDSGSDSDSSCVAVTCAAGDAGCAGAYQVSDDEDTHSCSSGVGVLLVLG